MGNGGRDSRGWGSASAIRRRHSALLFQCAYPASQIEWDTANRELRELAVGVSARPAAHLHNSGIAGSTVVAAFSLATTRWLVDRFPDAVTLDSLGGDPIQMMTILGPALDPLEQEVLAEHPLGWAAWQRRHLGTRRAGRLCALLSLVERIPGGSPHQEAAFASLRVFVRWRIPADAPIPTTGRLEGGALFLHRRALRRRTNLARAWREGPARRIPLTTTGRHHLCDLARGTLASLLGETDPFTHPALDQLEQHDLGEGVQVVLDPCTSQHKLALEAYVGYLLFKNRVPVAYGGGWVLGRQARFGINVLPPFRGGESARLLAQLLRLYAHRFGLSLFLVEPYQIGRGNADGIRSGAFWFYWRLGFRPRQRELLQLARSEARRVRAGGHRSTAATLRKLSHAVLAWRTPLQAPCEPVDVEAVGCRVSRFILEHHRGDRRAATRSAQRNLGIRDPRLATLLAAVAPPAGWPARYLARLDRVMLGKDSDELAQAIRLGRVGWLMDALARASTTEAAGT
ncbi:MAG: hypothetical protein KJZ47_07030 [Gemmatimonadales bacterium]|nr:hypothetical protein [Gemmatimonadales bacterium]